MLLVSPAEANSLEPIPDEISKTFKKPTFCHCSAGTELPKTRRPPIRARPEALLVMNVVIAFPFSSIGI
ncbi:MAG: hypothetical protein EBR01_09865 [Proteobacteria bacterium]|nr:hypothetical protein [Pseudomonadota bacterium]